ncbi:protein NYNRIN-like, partial [Trifolium medium]|nr:protein NYNRIN-like [Trifolium medium]
KERLVRSWLSIIKRSSGYQEEGSGWIPSIRETFHSAGLGFEEHIAAIEDMRAETHNWVYRCPPDTILTNWKAVVIPEITMISKSEPINHDNAIIPYDFELPINHSEEDGEEDCELPEELARLLEQEEKIIQPHQEPVDVINLGTEEEKKKVKIGASLQQDVKEKLVKLLQEYVDVFAWSYQDMSGLDTNIVEHKLPLKPECPPDDFPLPHIDVLVDNTAQFPIFSFMDGFSGYNQIKMAPEDMEKTTFITPWGTFCYKVMPFGLKNDGATYQRANVTLFHDMIHKEIEVYVDDMIAKSRTEDEHLIHLQKLFARLRKYRLRLNLNKCTFGVRSGKLLGFIVSQKGIEVDPDKLLRKDQTIEWNEECQGAFDKIKQYLQEPPVLVPPVPGTPLIMYLHVLDESMGCVLGQHDETGRKEHAIYYLSKKFTSCEVRYSLLEKTCCALAWAARRLKQYMVCNTTMLIAKMDPIKYIFEKPALTGRIVHWQMLLSEHDIQYVTQKAIKGSVLAEHLAHQPVEDYQPMCFEFPDEDIMALSKKIIVLISPRDTYTPFTARLLFDCTNNIAEYEACIMGLQADIELRIKILEVYGDSALVIYQEKPVYCLAIEDESDGKPWYHDIKNYLQKQEYPMGASGGDKKTLRRLASNFFLDGEVLYKRNYDLVLLLCVDRREADMLIEEIHEGSFGTHANGHAMAKKILRADYYRLTMETDCLSHVRKCHKCQIYADRVHVPPTRLNVLTAPWPFSLWGIDMIGMIEPKASNGHHFILVAIDYFTKWVEAASYTNVTSNLNNQTMKELCESFKIEHHNSSPYRPKMNGAVEAVNKNIKKIIQKMVKTYKNWHEMLPFTLHGYRTAVRTSTGASPFSLVYGMEAVLPVEVEIPSLRVLMEAKLEEAEWVQTRFDQLNLTEEKRMIALCYGQLYQQRLKKAFDKKVRPREFKEGDLVLKIILPIHKDTRGKWTPNYEGPYAPRSYAPRHRFASHCLRPKP